MSRAASRGGGETEEGSKVNWIVDPPSRCIRFRPRLNFDIGDVSQCKRVKKPNGRNVQRDFEIHHRFDLTDNLRGRRWLNRVARHSNGASENVDIDLQRIRKNGNVETYSLELKPPTSRAF